MKTFRLLLILCIFCTPAGAQQLTGLWTGTLTNDSATGRTDKSLELALTQYKQDVYGYSRINFIYHDTLYYIVKRVRGRIDGDSCIVEDEKILSFNFPGRLDKGVKISYTFHLNKKDSTWNLSGDWTTNKVKRKFFAMRGQISLNEDKNWAGSSLFPDLEELNLASDVPFYAASKKPPTETASSDKAAPIPSDKIAKADKKRAADAVKVKSKKDKADRQEEDREESPAPNQIATAMEKTPAAFVKQRKTPVSETISFQSDSLELSLYDNGEVDGDTVSVLLNGQVIIAQQELKTTAMKKTIHLAPGTDSVELILYAENLGKYPPNTGLLVVHDGETVYQVRFTADLQQNAAILFRRKKSR